jgi:Ser/Thr protein kinase RdoA (MazF antagonist)
MVGSEREEGLLVSFERAYNQPVKQMEELKSGRIYLLQTNTDRFVLKCYSDEEQVRWQEKCLQHLLDKNTKGIVPYVLNRYRDYVNAYEDEWYVVMPWIPGRNLNPNDPVQVEDGIKLLAHFHRQATGVYGKQPIIPFRSHVQQQWQDRLQQFEQSLTEVTPQRAEEYGLLYFMDQIGEEAAEWGRTVLESLSEAYLLFLEEQAQGERRVAHRDVAPHNFLELDERRYYLLDYDLLDYSPPVYDVLQYTNRMLPYYKWSFDFAFRLFDQYRRNHPYGIVQAHTFALFLIYPQDIYREWLGVYKHKAGYHPRRAFLYFQALTRSWPERKLFVRQCMSMLK